MPASAAARPASNTRARSFGLSLVLLCAGLLGSAMAGAAHTSFQCDPKFATVAVGGTVTIDVTDCATSIDFAGAGAADGPAIPLHGTANLRVAGGAWLADYTHNGNAATSDVFEFTDGTVGGRTVRVTITIDQPASALTLSPDTLPRGGLGAAYSQPLTAGGGVAPYTYAVTAGALPPGLSLSAGGTISGTPTAVGTFVATVTVTDSTAGSAQTLSRVFVMEVLEAAPVAVADTATARTGLSVAIPVTANDQSSSPITSIAITRQPSAGSAVVAGLLISFTAPSTPQTVTFDYVAIGPGGPSEPATVTVVVTANTLPTAARHFASTLESRTVTVDLTSRAVGFPFTAATLVSVTPVDAGAVSVAPYTTRNGYELTFVPVNGFVGDVLIRYTLTNAGGTSPENTVSIRVLARPDPTDDPGIRSLVDAQVESTRRFFSGQVGNFQQRLERLRGGASGGFANGLGFAIDRACIEPLAGQRPDPCASEGDGFRGGRGLANGTTAGTADAGGPVGTWIGGMIRSGSHDGRDGGEDIDFETDGVSAGIDYRVNDGLVVGAGFGYGKDENAIGSEGSRVDGEARTVALYASYHPGVWFVDVLLGYQTLEYDLLRNQRYSIYMLDGQRDGSQRFASLSVGADIRREDALITPYARLDLARAELDAYAENGIPDYALAFEAMDIDNTTASLGLRMRTMHEMSWGRLMPQFRVEYQHDIGGSSEAVIRFAEIVNGQTYSLASTGFNDSRLVVGLGAQFEFDNGWASGLELRSRIGDTSESDHGLRWSVQKQF